MIRHGWYSAKAAMDRSGPGYEFANDPVTGELEQVYVESRQYGSVYLTTEGKEVEVTCVTDTPDDHGMKWDDMVYVGEVTEWVRGLR